MSIEPPVADPWECAEPAGAQLLDEVHDFLGRFVAYPNPEAQVAHVLWCAHAHLMGCWETTARIAFLSPEKESGKTRALEITELLVPRPLMAVNMSSAALFRSIGSEDGLPTILFDEVDCIFGPKAREHEELRGLLNAGYRRGAKTYRCVVRGKTVEVEAIEAFSACALAGIGDLPDTLLSRSVIVRMRRRAPHERVEPYRRRLCAAAGEELRDRLAEWATEIEPEAARYIPELPSGIEDRGADCWEALLTVADMAGGGWPQRARVSAVTHVSQSRGSAQSLGAKLLEDLRAVFGDADHMATEDILKALHGMDESPWGDIRGKPLDPRGLARRLKPYGARPVQVRLGAVTLKGYRREDLHDAWSRYVDDFQPSSKASAGFSPSPPDSETRETPETSATPDAAEQPHRYGTDGSILAPGETGDEALPGWAA